MIERGRFFALLAVFSAACLSLCADFLLQPAYASGTGFYLVRQRGPREPVHSVSVDRQGFVWSAGPAGACRFDGLTTRCLSHGSAALISAARTGDDVWAVFSNGALRRVYPASPPSMQWRIPGSPTALLVTGDRVWVSSTSGMFVLEGGSQQEQSLHTVETGPVESLATVEDGAILASERGQMILVDAQLRPTQVTSPQISTPVSVLFGGANGGWLAATAHDIWRADKRGSSFKRVDFVSTIATPPLAAMETADGAIWVGVAGGLFHLPAGANRAIDVKGLPFSSPSFAVTALASSAADRVWLATPVGLYEVQSQVPARTVGQPGDEITIAFAVVAASPDGVWFSSGEGINWLSGSGLQKYGRAEGLKIPDLRAVGVDRKGEVWAGGLGSGLFKLDSPQKRFVTQTAIWPGGVRAILPSREGGLWLGLSDSGLVRVKDSQAHVVLPAAVNGANEVLDMLEAADGSLWVTFRTGGIANVRHGTLVYFPLPSWARSVELLCLLEDDEGGVLMGSNGKGLFRIAGEALSQVTMQQGLADDRIYGMTTDGQGRLWLSSPHGISHAPLSDVRATLSGHQQGFRSVLWGREEGITGEPVRAFPKSAATLSDGTLAFPALDGLIRIDPRLIRTPAPPEVVLDRTDFGEAGTQHFRSPSAHIQFTFSAPRHPRPHRLKFRFRLLGFETAWRIRSGIGEARYASVAPGTYHFEVQAHAAQEDGGPSSVVSAAVLILAPWYSTWTFRIFALALAVAGIFWRFRVRNARAVKLLDAQSAERRRIAADIHDGLSQDLVGLRLQLEAAKASLQNDPSNASKFLHRAGLLLDDGLKDLRDSIWGLNHDEVDSDSLANGLRERLERSTQDTAVSLRFENLGISCSIAPTVAWQITQIAREAVANAIKHAGAKQLTVTLCAVEHCITLVVADDGRGLDRAVAKPGVGVGFGLAGMKARAEALGAVLQIQNDPSGGTRVDLIVPRPGILKKRTLS